MSIYVIFLFVLHCMYFVLCGITNNIIGSLCTCTIQLICIMLLNACTHSMYIVHLCYRKLVKIVNKEILLMLFFIRVLLDFLEKIIINNNQPFQIRVQFEEVILLIIAHVKSHYHQITKCPLSTSKKRLDFFFQCFVSESHFKI